MTGRIFTTVAMAGILALASATGAMAADPDYVTIRKTVNVNASADTVWKKIGDYCAIRDWMKVTCEYTKGSGEVGSVRKLNNANVEPMVAKTAHSYTYHQTIGNMSAYDFHGTLAVEPAGANASVLSYTLFYDRAAMASDAVRESEFTRLSNRFQDLLGTMKDMAEAK